MIFGSWTRHYHYYLMLSLVLFRQQYHQLINNNSDEDSRNAWLLDGKGNRIMVALDHHRQEYFLIVDLWSMREFDLGAYYLVTPYGNAPPACPHRCVKGWDWQKKTGCTRTSFVFSAKRLCAISCMSYLPPSLSLLSCLRSNKWRQNYAGGTDAACNCKTSSYAV